MKSCEEMVDSLHKRRAKYMTAQRKRRKLTVRVGTSVCCACLTAVIGIGLWQRGLTQRPAIAEPNAVTKENSVPQSTETPNAVMSKDNTDPLCMPEGPILWKSDGTEIGDSWVVETVQWNGKTVTESLYEVLTDPNNTDVVIAIQAGFEMDEEFEYRGKTISQYKAEADEEEQYLYRLWGLLKEGESLKYGEALYQTGTPDGEKWAQSLYEEKIAEYGEDFLAIYIVDGEFLREKVEQDLEKYEARPLHKAYREAENAFYEYAFLEAQKKLDVYCERGWNCYHMILYATAEQFGDSPALEHVSGYSWAEQYGEYVLSVSSECAEDLS